MGGMTLQQSNSRYAYAILREILFPVVILFIMVCFSRYVESTGNIYGHTICMGVSVGVGFFCLIYYAIAGIYAPKIHKKAADYNIKYQDCNTARDNHFNSFFFFKIHLNKASDCSKTGTGGSENWTETDTSQIFQSNLIECTPESDVSFMLEHAEIISAKSKKKKCSFQEDLESIDSKLLDAIVDYLRKTTCDKTMHYGCMIIWLYKIGRLNYNSLYATHIHDYLKKTYSLDCPHRTNITTGLNCIREALKYRENKGPEDKLYAKYLKCYDEIAQNFQKYL